MPTYQYVCTECSEPLEAVQSFTDAPLTVCPACSGKLRKVFSAVGVVFKGSGFYRNDSRDSGSKTTTKPKKATATAEASTSETKASDSKPSESKSTPKATESAAKPKAPAAATA